MSEHWTASTWFDENYDAIEELWHALTGPGQQLFGNAFMQYGTFGDFAHYVYTRTVPGQRS